MSYDIMIYPEGDRGSAKHTHNPLVAQWWLFVLGQKELLRWLGGKGLPRRMCVETRPKHHGG